MMSSWRSCFRPCWRIMPFLCSSEYYVGQQHEKDIWRPDCDKGYLLLPLLQHQQQRTQPQCGRTAEQVEVDWAAVHRAASAPMGPSCWPLPVDTLVSELLVLSHAWHPQRPRQYRILEVSTETLGECLRREDERDEFVRKKLENLNGRDFSETTSGNASNGTAKEAVQREEQPREGEKGEREEDDEETAIGGKRKVQEVRNQRDQQQQGQQPTKKAKPLMTRELLEQLLATDLGELAAEATKETGEDIRHEPQYSPARPGTEGTRISFSFWRPRLSLLPQKSSGRPCANENQPLRQSSPRSCWLHPSSSHTFAFPPLAFCTRSAPFPNFINGRRLPCPESYCTRCAFPCGVLD